MATNIIGIARTPFIPILGALAEESSVILGSTALKGALNMGFTSRDVIDRVVLSQVFTTGCGPSPSKQIAYQAGLRNSTSCFQTSQLCTSGLKAVSLAHDMLHSGKSHCLATVGVESTSQAPYILKNARMQGYGVGDGVLVDSVTSDGFSKMEMDLTDFTESAKISKLDMMQYAAESFRRVAACYSDGIMQNEIVPMVVKNRGSVKSDSDTWISHSQVKLTSDALHKAFVPNQASQKNIKVKSTMADGAGCILISKDVSPGKGRSGSIARIVDYVEVSTDGGSFPHALVSAIKEIQTRVRQSVDIYEIMDQYAFLPIFVSKELNIDPSRINVHGSTLSIGHPMGKTNGSLKLTNEVWKSR
ncbi:thiolase like protein [Babesia gibsoni]|uniref:Thiolase like protein n=1 Tax=Babesia gibsoni TaxID=33632 RepID=A0AAD8PD45_BABGI|nr:thiolase like protein [Babesia gibsoni]